MTLTSVQRMTTADFEAFLARPEQADRRYELIDGEIIAKAMPTLLHNYIAARLIQWLNNYFDAHPELGGIATAETRHRPTGDPLNDRLPDVSVILGLTEVRERGVEDYIPPICVEVLSPDDSLKATREKAVFYLAHGARYALVVLPAQRTVEVYTVNGDDAVLVSGDDLTFPDLLPGFAVPVAKIFPPASA